ncbi:conserved hypothetical protein [Streptomyces scabiei 87.22]|uniref:Uncharacterized protein n=1 Tax=Streptomyces scabiei (strain 87.22) TaxID=680198 RepID=C9Z2D4_STRSW|nr:MULTISPECIES: hypothetical protein [Streptomyces]MDX2575477.1 hypothetical protein [Streptomyces scabiei]MDX2653043.1 hypothetical protein [Streptomyces scabiei]MDX2718800.1 hypothetical protein [Streptomyces scabiei]MDX2865148.1 hypothetical protein [Streptomyces scabiei]MDX2883502.1 hypothetical protein [Streptomyces scabiei]
MDAKYKANAPEASRTPTSTNSSPCTRLGLPTGHLVCARTNAPHAAHVIRNADIRIHRHALDLDQPPERLLAEVSGIATSLGAPLGSSALPT